MRQVNRWSSVFGVAMLLLGAAFVSFPGGAVLADTSFSQIGADIDGEAASDNSGNSVAMSADGSRVAIGAPNNGGNGSGSGQVRVYTLVNGVWTQTGVDIDGEAAGDASGWSVAMSADGSRVAIGARSNGGNGSGSGHVRVYTLDNGVWTQTGVDIDGEAAGDNSGRSVAMSADGSRVAIGAVGNDGNGSNSGQVRVFTLVNGVWTQTGVDIDGEAAGDASGWSVAMSANGSRVAIGSRWNDGNGIDSGHVRVYTLVNGAWTQTGVDIDGEAAGDDSGQSVAMSADGSRVAIGAVYNGPASVGGGGPGLSAGQVRVFTLVNGVWTQMGADIDGEGATDNAGFSVAMSVDGSRVAIGAPNNDGGGGFGVYRGQVRVFAFTNGGWTQTGADIDGGDGLGFGQSVAMSADGSRVVGSSVFNGGSNAGQVRVYEGFELTTTTTIAPATTTVAPDTTTFAPATTVVSPTTTVSPLVLPSTGSQSDGWLIVGIFALILGTVLVTRRRKIG